MVLASSCKARKVETIVKEKSSDTLIVKSEKITAPSLSQVLKIKELCDTTTAKAKEIEQVFVVNGDSIELLIGQNNNLELKIRALERTLEQNDSVVSTKTKNVLKSKETIKYRINWIWIIGAFILGVVIEFIKPWRNFY